MTVPLSTQPGMALRANCRFVTKMQGKQMCSCANRAASGGQHTVQPGEHGVARSLCCCTQLILTSVAGVGLASFLTRCC